MRIHVVPGWAEGNWQFKQLVRDDSRFQLERDAAKADVIFSHSSGVYSLPGISPHQIVLIVDPPYWPGRGIVSRIIQNVLTDTPAQIKDFGVGFWLRLRLANILYIIIEPWRHIKIWRSLRKTFELSLKAERVALIRDRQDAYCGQAVRSLLKGYPSIRYIEVDGLHETCWAHPKRYLDVIDRLQV